MPYPVHIVPLEPDGAIPLQQLQSVDPDFSRRFRRGDKVILKPNFVAPRKSSTGTTTSLELIRALAGMLKDNGAEPYLCESPGMEYSWEQVFEYLGIRALARM